MNTKKFGNAIARRRTELGLTQQEVAARIKIPQHSVSALENGLRDPKLSTLTKLAKALKIDLSSLIASMELKK